jgi:hypothetical protein
MSFNNQGETAKRSIILSGIFPDLKSISEAGDGCPNLPPSHGIDSMRAIDKAESDWTEREKKKFYKATDGHVVYIMRNPNVAEVVTKKNQVFVQRIKPVAVAKVAGGNAVRGYEYEILNQEFLDRNNIRTFGSPTTRSSAPGSSFTSQAGEAF